jgi:hypothetical protein
MAWASSQSQRTMGVVLELEELLGPGPWPECIELGHYLLMQSFCWWSMLE